jgi:hypothetical protein
MTDRHIRAMLRGATAAKILNGWQGPHLLERSYCIAPRDAAAAERPLADVISYCESLATAGVQPLFRESEPLMYPPRRVVPWPPGTMSAVLPSRCPRPTSANLVACASGG